MRESGETKPKKVIKPYIHNLITLQAGCPAKSANKVSFTNAGRTAEENVMRFLDVRAKTEFNYFSFSNAFFI